MRQTKKPCPRIWSYQVVVDFSDVANRLVFPFDNIISAAQFAQGAKEGAIMDLAYSDGVVFVAIHAIREDGTTLYLL